MSLRAVWILRQPRANESCQVLLKRKFALADQKAKIQNCETYVPIPRDEDFGKNLFIALGFVDMDCEFVEWRDCIDKHVQRPVIDVKTDGGMLWPVIVIDHGSLLLCALSLVEEPILPQKRPALFELPSITVAFMVLEGIASLLGNQGESKLQEVETFIGLCLPFGRPYDTDPFNALTLLGQCDGNLNSKQKSSAKSPVTPKGKSNMSIGIRETVRCVQWHQSQPQNEVDVFGSVLIKAELENQPTDVAITLNHWEKDKNLVLENILYHSCLHNTNWVHTESVSSSSWKKIKFTPPSHRISLCHYTIPKKEPPIYGQYELKGQEEVEIELQLVLNKDTKNLFNYCEARFPFANRGKIRHVDCKPTWGHVHLTDDKQTLVWNIGQKFPKTLLVSLSAKVRFLTPNITTIGNSTYVQLQFLIQDYTMSGCYVDTKVVQFSPACRVRLQTERELRSAEYKIWNRNAEVPYSFRDNISTLGSMMQEPASSKT